MSVPPLLCSTPPPPDQIDEEVYNDEFTFNYEDASPSSPSHEYEDSRRFSLFDSPSSKEPSPSKSIPEDEETTQEISSTIEDSKSSEEKTEKTQSVLHGEVIDSEKKEEFRVVEDNNIEDLDLKLDSLQIDFQNCKESVEDSLNSTFDDFGTFLGSSGLNESPDSSFYLPKPADAQNSDGGSEKELKLQETCSEDSASLQNDSDFEVGWENPNQSSYSNSKTPDISDQSRPPEIDFHKNITEESVLHDDIVNSLETSKSSESIDSKNENESINVSSDVDVNSKNDEFDEVPNAALKPLSNKQPTNKDLNNVESDVVGMRPSVNIEDVKLKDNSLQSTDLFNSIAVHSDSVNDDDFGAFNDVNDSKECDTYLDNSAGTETPCFFPNDDAGSSNLDDFEDFATFHSPEPLTSALAVEQVETSFIKSMSEKIHDDVTFEAFTENNNCSSQEEPIIITRFSTEGDIESDGDDFGDFDTYEPSDLSTIPVSSSGPFQLAEFGNSNETEVFEKLCKAIDVIFPIDDTKEGSDKTDNVECELKSTLGESWKHLKDCEAEQSYLFLWNSSTSQKSLLRSLGIDSRNILFGPKWNTNMPRFAANLGANPLQPIRQAPSATLATDSVPDEKSGNCSDTSGTLVHQTINEWDNVSNFSTGDLQASSYAESLLLDLEHLMATLDQMTSGQSAHFKISDLFTNACNERAEEHITQPSDHPAASEHSSKAESIPHPSLLNIGRKINLPDTHIFTPTDSETPWSHTIHYNDSNTEHNLDIKNVDCPNTFSPNTHVSDYKLNENKEPDDFDDFQSHIELTNTCNPIDTFEPEKISKLDNNFDNGDSIQQEYYSNSQQQTSFSLTAPDLGSEDFDDFGDFHSAEVIENSAGRKQSVEPTRLLEPVKLSPAIPVVNWPAPGEVRASVFTEYTDVTLVAPLQPPSPLWTSDNVNIQPYDYPKISSGPTSFILKESKIDSHSCENVHEVLSSTKDIPVDFKSFGNYSDNNPIKASASEKSTSLTNSFIQPFPKVLDSSKHISSDAFESIADSSNDDFEDFQSVDYIPTYSGVQDIPIGNGNSFVIPSNSNPKREYQQKPQTGYQMPITFNNEIPAYGNNFERTPLEPISIQKPEEVNFKNTTQQILQPLSLENYSQINWPEPGIDLQDLSRFNPINSIQSYCEPKETATKHNSLINKQVLEDDGWSDFVSIKPGSQNVASNTNKLTGPSNVGMYNQPSTAHFIPNSSANDDSEDWSDFVGSAVSPLSEVKTISQNIHSQANSAAPSYAYKGMNASTSNSATPRAPALNSVPQLSYVYPKANTGRNYNNHFQNL